MFKKLFHHRRAKNHIPDGNALIVGDQKSRRDIPGLHIGVQGTGNVIRIHPQAKFNRMCTLHVWGDNNHITIDKTSVDEFHVFIQGNGHKLKWGAGTTANGATIVMAENNTRLDIGRDCMLSNAHIRTSDGHAIYDKNTGRILNHGARDMRIGNHCWICFNSQLNKNAKLGDNIIVAAHSVVSNTFDEPYSIIGGIPARVIKNGVCFSRIDAGKFGEFFDRNIERRELKKLNQ